MRHVGFGRQFAAPTYHHDSTASPPYHRRGVNAIPNRVPGGRTVRLRPVTHYNSCFSKPQHLSLPAARHVYLLHRGNNGSAGAAAMHIPRPPFSQPSAFQSTRHPEAPQASGIITPGARSRCWCGRPAGVKPRPSVRCQRLRPCERWRVGVRGQFGIWQREVMQACSQAGLWQAAGQAHALTVPALHHTTHLHPGRRCRPLPQCSSWAAVRAVGHASRALLPAWR